MQRSHGVLLFTVYMLPFILLKPSNKTTTTRVYTWKLQNSVTQGLYVKNTYINHVILWFCGLVLCLFFLPLSLTLTVLPLPALNKDNYSGNISANQKQPCILPVRKATSQDLANNTGAWSPCLKNGAFPGWGLRVSSMFYKCWHNSVSGSHASTEVSSVFFILTLIITWLPSCRCGDCCFLMMNVHTLKISLVCCSSRRRSWGGLEASAGLCAPLWWGWGVG